MRTCTICKLTLDSSNFIKLDKYPELNLAPTYFKLCQNCREKGRIKNADRRNKKNKQSKAAYEINKQEILIRNKNYRDNNKDKLKAYEKSPQRKLKNKKWRDDKRQEDPCRFMFYSAKRRAQLGNLPFEINKEDIINIYPIDKKCPILNIDLIIGKKYSTDNSPTLDKIIPERGYVKDNIVVVSYRANRIKNDSSLEELEKIVSFLKDWNNK